MRDGRRRQRVNGTAAPRAPPPQPQRPRDAAESEGTLNSPAASTHQRCTRDSERPNARRLSVARRTAQSVVSEPDASSADAVTADAERAESVLTDVPVVDGAKPDVPGVDAAVDVVSVDVVAADSASDVSSATDVVASRRLQLRWLNVRASTDSRDQTQRGGDGGCGAGADGCQRAAGLRTSDVLSPRRLA